MASKLGEAFVRVRPDTAGFNQKLSSDLSRVDASGAGRKSGESYNRGFGGSIKKVGALATGAFATAAVGALGFAVKTQASFEKTMNILAAQGDVPKAQMGELSKLALKMGADTVFSANEAADAMLELSKGGLTAAEIKAGGLAGTLTLASAGQLELADAATYTANAMNMFALKSKDVPAIADALAGAANASTASVQSLGLGLSQVGPGARNAGLNLNDTVGVLAAFDQAGIKGSDAGTSLKTMLSRLEPQTMKASMAMKGLGLDFTDAKGSFIPIRDVAEQLKQKMSGLSEAQRTTAMNTLFGSDATRAATVLMNSGAAGVDKFTAATLKSGSAQKVADAAMGGTAGAIERMKGSVETAALAVGQKLAPAVTAGANGISRFLGEMQSGTGAGGRFAGILTAAGNAVAGFSRFVRDNRGVVLSLVGAMGGLLLVTQAHTAFLAVQAAGGMLAFIRSTRIVTALTRAWTAVQWLLNIAMRANPIGLVVTVVAALAGGLIYAYKHSETFRRICTVGFAAVRYAAVVAFQNIGTVVLKVFAAMIDKAADVAEALHLPMAKSLRRAATATTAFKDKFIRDMQRARDNAAVDLRLSVSGESKVTTALTTLKKNMIAAGMTNLQISQGLANTRKAINLPNAAGNVYERHDAQIAPGGAMRLWAEPETGGESYIPHAPAKRARSVNIWKETGKILGVLPNADGAIYRPRINARLDSLLPRIAEANALTSLSEGHGDAGILAFIKSLDSHPYVWGGAGPNGYDCSGITGAVYLAMKGKPYGHGQRPFYTGSNFGALGFASGAGGLYDIGVNSGTHMAGSYGGFPFEAESTKTGIKVGRAASPVGSFRKQYHIGTAASGGGGGASRWSGVVLQALREVGQSSSMLSTTLRRMNQESGGNPRAINNSDVNARRGDPSKGLMQVIGTTFRAYAGKYAGRGVYDPLANVYASMMYALSRYGSLSAAYNKKGGYRLGTNFVPQDGPAYLHKGEAVVPAALNRKTAAPVEVRVFIGERELTDIVRVTVDDRDVAMSTGLRYGRA